MTLIQAHRGFSELYPESTMLAYRKAHEAGADGLETDIRKTSDGHFVLIHDATIDRTVASGLKGSVESYTLSELKAMDFSFPGKFGTAFQGRTDCKILTLSEFLDEFKGTGVHLVLQIKVWMKADILSIVDMVVSKGMLNQCHFFGDAIYIKYVRDYNSTAITYNDGGATLANYQTLLDNAIQNKHDAVSIQANSSIADLTTMINAIKGAGKIVHASYISSDFAAKTALLKDLGVDMILGDNPELMREGIPKKEVITAVSKDLVFKKDGEWRKTSATLMKNSGKWVNSSGISVKI